MVYEEDVGRSETHDISKCGENLPVSIRDEDQRQSSWLRLRIMILPATSAWRTPTQAGLDERPHEVQIPVFEMPEVQHLLRSNHKSKYHVRVCILRQYCN